jgi:hypothetical protein
MSLYYNLTNTTVLNPAETLYTIWIGDYPRDRSRDEGTDINNTTGTNDVGSAEILTGQTKGDIVGVSECAVNTIATLYASGARNFLLQNVSNVCYAPKSALSLDLEPSDGSA